MGALKYAGAAAMPMMADSGSQLNAKPQGQGNIVDYSFDPITGQYRKLRTTPTPQYPGMAKGGITEALHYADGGYTQADLSAIDAAIASANDGTKTEEERNAIRDKVLSTYSADALAAAPSLQSFGYNAADYAAAQAN